MNQEAGNNSGLKVTLVDGINWVGYIDWTIRDFHSYITSRGATYNAYLIQDETKNALIDTVKKPFGDYLIQNISSLIDPSQIDYIIINHAEPDHAGSLPDLVLKCPKAQLVCTDKCRNILSAYHDTKGWNFKCVKSGDTISLGQRTLTFLETPMVHWPDSMFTYIPEEKILFSMDAFGQHYASINRFDDEVELNTVLEEARKYYANIVMLYGRQIKQTLEKARNLEIKMIAPAHGIIWRSHITEILSAYRDWVEFAAKPKVLVIYDSMWESTKKMGEAIVKGASVEGMEAKLINARATGLTEIATEVLDAAAIAFGSATLNMGMMPMMSAVLTYLKGLRPEGKVTFAFGSYGWGKGGAEAIHEVLSAMNLEIIREPLKGKWKPAGEVLAECRSAGALLARKAREISRI